MNLSSSFSFGGLIKTMLPGLFLVLAAVLAIDLAFPGFAANILPQVPREFALALGLAAALFLGVTLNSIVFLGLNDLLIRSPHRRRHAELYALENALLNRMVSRICCDLGPELQLIANKYGQLEELLQRFSGGNNYMELRERYWFYMEFQVNSAIAVMLCGAAAVVWLNSNYYLDYYITIFELSVPAEVVREVGVLLGCLTFAGLMLWAARRNYDRHKRKLLAMCLAAFSLSGQNGMSVQI